MYEEVNTNCKIKNACTTLHILYIIASLVVEVHHLMQQKYIRKGQQCNYFAIVFSDISSRCELPYDLDNIILKLYH